MNKSVLILCPEFPPANNGLADYTNNLYQNIKSKSIPCFVISSYQNDDPNIFFCNDWWFNSFSLIRKTIKENDISTLIIQWVPQMYSKKGGLNILLPFYLLFFRLFSKVQVKTMFHEVNYPFEASLRGLILAPLHLFQAFILCLSSNKIFVSTIFFKSLISRIYFFKTPMVLPIGRSLMTNVNVGQFNPQSVNILFFGGDHPTKRIDLAFKIIEKLTNENISFKFHFVGTDLSKYPNFLNHENVVSHGKLSDSEVVDLFKKIDVAYGYFSDGLSTRRSSMINALCSGIPVISNLGFSSDKKFFDTGVFLLSSSPDEFVNDFARIIIDQQFRELSRESISTWANKTFSWESITNTYLE